jgi:ABC-type glycerol-3-phosphate transport system permease component
MRTARLLTRRAGLYAAVAAFCCWILFPLAFTITSSFQTPSQIGAKPYHWLPAHPTLANYSALFTGDDTPFGPASDLNSSFGAVEGILPAIGHSVLIGVVLVLCNLVVGGAAAYALSRYPFRGSTAAYVWLLVSRVVPAIAIVSPFFVTFQKLGLLDTPWALIVSYNVFTLPLCVWLLKSYFDTLPREVEHAAMIDGATRLRALVSVVLPLARPGLIAAGLLVFLESWSEFFYSLVLTNRLTVPPLVAGLQSLQQFSWTTLAAATIVTLLPPVALAVVFQRYIVGGLARGSIQ